MSRDIRFLELSYEERDLVFGISTIGAGKRGSLSALLRRKRRVLCRASFPSLNSVTTSVT